ncbi:hypothetical protein IPM09_01225 [Candidatus Saccharibacteria bacterium]|nr:MAG: hypothetical protein IPM09_01225 [Candidatus Saccharibacteria bacterium]
MEFEKRHSTIEVTEEAVRMEASSRSLSVIPLHDNVVPDDLPDTLIAAQHALAPPIANLPDDSEVTPSLPSMLMQARRNHHIALTSSIAVAGIVTTFVTISLLGR